MSIIKQVTLQKIVAHDFRYDPRIYIYIYIYIYIQPQITKIFGPHSDAVEVPGLLGCDFVSVVWCFPTV